MNEWERIDDPIIAKVLAEYPEVKISEASYEELDIDKLADRYFTPDLRVSIGLKHVKILKLYDENGKKVYWVNGFLQISTKLVNKGEESGALVNFFIIRPRPDYAILKGTFNGKEVMLSLLVTPSEWFIDVVMHAAKVYLNEYGEKSLIKFKKHG